MNDWSRAVSKRAAEDLAAVGTITGNHGLQIEEKLIFEQDLVSAGGLAVDRVVRAHH